ncbi:MAG: hypothetical protein V4696_03785 [Pseudomonadota bacterium]
MFVGPIKTTVASVASAGLGAITPGASVDGGLTFSEAIPSCHYLFRVENSQTEWENFYGWWNGTTISRAASQRVSSSTGAQITVTTASKVMIVIDPDDVMPGLGSGKWGIWNAPFNSTSVHNHGIAAPTATGTAAAVNCSNTGLQTMSGAVQYTSAASNGAIVSLGTSSQTMRHTTAGRGGFDMRSRWGPLTLPVNSRLMIGAIATQITTTEPSASVNCAMFAKDSTDTNIQFMVNDASGVCTKVDTGFAPAGSADVVYEMSVFCPMGGGYVRPMFFRLDNGDCWVGAPITTNLPASGTVLGPQVGFGSAPAATVSSVMRFNSMYLKNGF